MTSASLAPGTLLRGWRRRRRLSQLELALEAGVSQRHLSFVESGRAMPSRGMLLRLAERLAIPLRERNTLLTAAGFAPAYGERRLDEPALDTVREAVTRIVDGHAPHPALAVDRHWNLVVANRAVTALLDGVAASLLAAPANVLRIGLHPEGLAPRIANFGEWREQLLARLAREVELTADVGLKALLDELTAYPAPARSPPQRDGRPASFAAVAIPLELETAAGRLAFISTTTVFGTAVDVTVAELTIETFFPADTATAEAMRRLG